MSSRVGGVLWLHTCQLASRRLMTVAGRPLEHQPGLHLRELDISFETIAKGKPAANMQVHSSLAVLPPYAQEVLDSAKAANRLARCRGRRLQ